MTVLPTGLFLQGMALAQALAEAAALDCPEGAGHSRMGGARGGRRGEGGKGQAQSCKAQDGLQPFLGGHTCHDTHAVHMGHCA